MNHKQSLLWLDLETTGTDEHEDAIIEVACIPTNADLVELGEFSSVVSPPTSALNRLLLDAYLKNMHESNGLLQSLTYAPELEEVEDEIFVWLRSVFGHPISTITLAGSGVGHFDLGFIRAQMPRLASLLSYNVIDIGVVRRAHEMWVGTEVSAANESKTHRALDDIRCHLDEARAYRNLWRSEYANALT